MENFEALSKERVRDYRLCGEGFFALIEEQGNSKESVTGAIGAVLYDLQMIMLNHAEQMTAEESLRWGADILLIMSMFRTLLENPMWDTEALTLQFRNQFEHHLKGARGMEIDLDEGKS